MKRAGRVLLALLCLLCLAGCAGESAPETTPEPRPLEDRSLPELSREEALSMLNWAAAGRALIAGDRLYTLDYDADFRPRLAGYSLDGGPSLSIVLAEDCTPAWLCLGEGRLYYVNTRAASALESVDLEGGDRKILREGPCAYLRFNEGQLCYCDGEGRYCHMSPDGTETVVSAAPCAWAWELDDGRLLCRDLTDGRLQLRWPEDGHAVALSAEAAEAPRLWGQRLYYQCGDALWSQDLDGGDARRCDLPALCALAELLPEGDGLSIRGVSDDEGLRQWTARPEDPAGSLRYGGERGYRLYDHLGDAGTVEAVYNPDGRLRCFLYTDAAGRQYVYMGGRVAG